MKKFTLIILILISINSFSQVLIDNINFISNNQNDYNFGLISVNTNFESVDSNMIMFTNYNDTIIRWTNYAYSETYLSETFYNSFSNSGYYDLFVYNNIDDTMFLEKALYVDNGNARFSQVEIKKCHTDSSYTINLSVLNLNLTSVTYSYAFLINKENDTIVVDFINKIYPNQLEFHFQTDSNSSGVYSLYYFNNSDTLVERNTIYIENKNRNKIDSINPNNFNTYHVNDVVTIYGNNTHFTNDTNIIYFDFRIPFFAYNIYNYQVINDTIIKFNLSLLMFKYADSCDLISIYNTTDGLMQYPYMIGIIISNKDISEDNSFNIYPNPAANVLNIEFNDFNNESFDLKIYSSDMKLMKNESFSSVKYSVNISDLNKGIYFIELISETKRSILKFIKD